MKLLSRRTFFRGARTAVVGGAAASVVAAVGLPALPKPQRLIPFKFNTFREYQLCAIEKIINPPIYFDGRKVFEGHWREIARLIQPAAKESDDV